MTTKPRRRAGRSACVWGVAILGSLATCVAGTTQQACTPEQRQDARTVLDVTKGACIIASWMLPDDRVKAVCNVLDAEDEPMRRLLSSQRVEVAKVKVAAKAEALEETVGRCGPRPTADAGAPR